MSSYQYQYHIISYPFSADIVCRAGSSRAPQIVESSNPGLKKVENMEKMESMNQMSQNNLFMTQNTLFYSIFITTVEKS